VNWPTAADCAAACGGAPVPAAGAGRKVEDLADALAMINATLVNLESRPALKGALSDDELGNLRNASAFLAEHAPAAVRNLETLRSWFRKDTSRPDLGDVTSSELCLEGCPNHLRADLKHADALLTILNGA
jgi:hypothetical protein